MASSDTRRIGRKSSSNRRFSNVSSATRRIAAGSSSSRWVAAGSSSNRWIAAEPGDDVPPILFTPFNVSALANLSQDLTINGTTITNQMRYEMVNADASGVTATAGDNLTVVGSPPIVGEAVPMMSLADKSTKFDGTAHYTAPNNGAWQFGLDDFIIELVLANGNTTSGEVLCGKLISGANKCEIFPNPAGPALLMASGGVGKNLGSALGSSSAGRWTHSMIFVDRSGSGIIYTNNTPGPAVDVTALVAASLDFAKQFTLGSRAGAAGFTERLAYLATWRAPGWLDTHLQAALVAERLYQVTGQHAAIASANAVPSTATRSSAATLYKWNETLKRVEMFSVGKNWMRTVSARDDVNMKIIKGVLVELAATNIIPYGVDISNAAWTKSGMSVSATVVTPPDQSPSAVSVMHEDNAAAAQHRMYDAAPMTSGEDYVVSFYAKALGRTWVAAAQNVNTGYVRVSFDLSNGTVGTVVDASGYYVGSGMQNCGDGWYRCWIATTGQSTTTNESLLVYIAAGDNAILFNGLDQDSVAIWGIQTELGAKPSSLIKTDGASAVRVKDSLGYTLFASDTNTGECSVFCESKTLDAKNQAALWYLRKDGAEYARLYGLVGNTLAHGHESGAVQWSLSDAAGSSSDDQVHGHLVTWKANRAEHTLDGSLKSADNTVTPPGNFILAAIGSTNTDAEQRSGIISNVSIYNRVVSYADIASLLEDAT